MKKLAFALIGTSALALAACHNDNQDQINNAELNQPSVEVLNEQANQAALDAANAVTPANKGIDENVSANVTDPTDAQEQNVSGM